LAFEDMSRDSGKFGLDADLALKEASKYNPKDEQMVMGWIASVTGKHPGGEILDALKDGTILIALANCLTKKSYKANESSMPFKQMENIANFLKSCREDLKMRENDLFTTADLYDGKSRVNVINGLVAVSRAAQKAGYSGPSIAPKETGATDVKHHEVGNPNASVSFLSQGSSATMERLETSKANNITFGNESSGKGTGEVSKMNMGSHGVMERSEVSKANDIDFGNKSSKK